MNTYITNHMDDIKRALLGDKEAAKRLTDAGVLLTCPFCAGKAKVVEILPGGHLVKCGACEMLGPMSGDVKSARLSWNTRAPILSKIEMERLEGME